MGHQALLRTARMQPLGQQRNQIRLIDLVIPRYIPHGIFQRKGNITKQNH